MKGSKVVVKGLYKFVGLDYFIVGGLECYR